MAFVDLKKQYEFLREDLDKRISQAVRHFSFIQGPEVRELEEKLAKFTDLQDCVTCANGTDALTLPLIAWEVKAGDAVFVPAFTFIATAEVVALRGATPVFVDVDEATFNMDPIDLERKIKKVLAEGQLKPKAIITVDLFGLPADFWTISHIALRYNLYILEDAAQAFGGEINGQKACNFGHAGATSFFPAKPLGCYGDGGAVLMSDPYLAKVVRSLRVHGAGAEKYLHERVGLNSRLDTIQAAILLGKFAALPEELDKRETVANWYRQKLKRVAWHPIVPEGFRSAYAQYTIRIRADFRATLMEELKKRGIPTMIYYPRPLHLQPAFAGLGGRVGDCPTAERLCDEVLSLPFHPYLTEEDVDRVCSALSELI
ncbi:MAG: DegT/DnrJ/EryC1/StrS family aminotransferase [Deltaproteobacteria bacterium]|jgi:dTDP-4-amino-4,6-dideoxygalactose transaminase|nr:DegT/DnrJ/EryC1/StrS family aminotransferase [Deltaproteobacteria bacterium]